MDFYPPSSSSAYVESAPWSGFSPSAYSVGLSLSEADSEFQEVMENWLRDVARSGTSNARPKFYVPPRYTRAWVEGNDSRNPAAGPSATGSSLASQGRSLHGVSSFDIESRNFVDSTLLGGVLTNPGDADFVLITVDASTSRWFDDRGLVTFIEPMKVSSAMRRLAEIAALADGWDGPDSLAPAIDIVSKVTDLVSGLPPSLAQPQVTVSDDGEIGLTWFRGKDRSDAIAYPDGDFVWSSMIDGEFCPGMIFKLEKLAFSTFYAELSQFLNDT